MTSTSLQGWAPCDAARAARQDRPVRTDAAVALDRYLRLRRGHRLATTSDALWLGDRGKRFSYDALHKSLRDRADAASVAGFHPHRLRHTAGWPLAGPRVA